YCYRVAGTVGLMMCRVMGAKDARALPYAAALGMGMQLTNIARDVAEDWERGRLYLPREALPASLHHSTLGGPLTSSSATDMSAAVRALLDAAEPFYRWGDAGLAYLDGTCAVAVRAARLIYSDIGRVIRSRGCDVLRGRAVVSRRRKIWLASRAAATVAATRVFRRRQARIVGTLPALPGPLPPEFTKLLEGVS
ncbi:MAG TPA: squalene/phytoene synthase family protein, partial [Polyangia bacterium]